MKASERPSTMSEIGRPDVLDEMIASGRAAFSIRSITDCLTSRRSTTTSMIQSASRMVSKSSSKLPSVIRFCASAVKNGSGLSFAAAVKAPWTRLSGAPSLPMLVGVTSSSVTVRPALARCAAICEPITPAPSTAAVRNGFSFQAGSVAGAAVSVSVSISSKGRVNA